MILRKILMEMKGIRKELQAIQKSMESNKNNTESNFNSALVEKAALDALNRPIQLSPDSLGRRLQPEQNDE